MKSELQPLGPVVLPCPGCERQLRLPAEVDQPTGLCPHCGCEMDLSRWHSGEVSGLADPVAASLIGRELGGYRLHRIIGRGGMGYVYLGEDLTTHEEVAVKVLRDDLKNTQRVVERFERESEALARLNHPNIVSLLDRGHQEGFYFLVMERIGSGSGQPTSLKSLIRRRALTIPQSIRIVQKILSALEAAHRQDIIHRDVKPANILIDDDGEVKVTDFGIARFLRSRSGGTAPGEDPAVGRPRGDGTPDSQIILGSLAYMAPEQKKSHAVDRRADIYSVGVLFYEMVVGRRPGLKYVPPSEILPGLGSFLDTIIERAIEPSLSKRYASAAEMLVDMERALDSPTGETVTSTRVAVAELEWDEHEEEGSARGEYRCPICGKTGPNDRDRCFYCGLSKRRRCPRCQARVDMAASLCPTCDARLPALAELVALVRDAEASFEVFRRDKKRSSKRIETAQLLLERYDRARALGADERDVRARVAEVRRELMRMLLKNAQGLAGHGQAEQAMIELRQILQLGDVPEARMLLEELAAKAAAARYGAEKPRGKWGPTARPKPAPAPAPEPPPEPEREPDPEPEPEVDVDAPEPDPIEAPPPEFESVPAAAVAAEAALPVEEPVEAILPDIDSAEPIELELPPSPRVQHPPRPGVLVAVTAFVLIAAAMGGRHLGWLPDLRFGWGGSPGSSHGRSWSEAEASSRRLAESGRLFEAASTLFDARSLPGSPSGEAEDRRVADWVAQSVRERLSAGDEEEACRQLAWWTARFPEDSTDTAGALQLEILTSRIRRDVAEGDFRAAAESLRFLSAVEPDGYAGERANWSKFLFEGVRQAAGREDYQAAVDALKVLEIWGEPEQKTMGARLAAILGPFAEDPSLARGFKPFISEDMDFGMPIPKSLRHEISEKGNLYHFVLPDKEGVPPQIPLQVILLDRDPLAETTVGEQALHYRNGLLANQRSLADTGHARMTLDGRIAEWYSFLHPGVNGGTPSSIEFYLFEEGGRFYILTLIIGEANERELRSLLLVSLSHLRVFE